MARAWGEDKVSKTSFRQLHSLKPGSGERHSSEVAEGTMEVAGWASRVMVSASRGNGLGTVTDDPGG